MALSKIKQRINKVIQEATDNIDFFEGIAGPVLMRVELGNTNIINYKQGGDRALAKDQAMHSNISVDPMEVLRNFNTVALWEDIVKEIHSELVKRRSFGPIKIGTYQTAYSKGAKLDGVYFGAAMSKIKNSITLPIFIYARTPSVGENLLDVVIETYIQALWDAFLDRMDDLNPTGSMANVSLRRGYVTRKGTKGAIRPRRKRSGAFRAGITKAHDENSTRAMLGQQAGYGDYSDIGGGGQMDLYDKTAIKVNYGITYNDLSLWAKSVKVDWNQVAMKKQDKKVVGKFIIENYIRIELGRNIQGLPGDAKNIKGEVFNQFLGTGPRATKIINDLASALSISKADSNPLKNQLAEEVAVRLITPLTKKGKPDMRFKVNKKSGKPFKRKTRSANIRKPSGKQTGKKVTKSKTINLGGRARKGAETGQGREASTSQAEDLARLKKYIQSRLPAEVRRNMGRPALMNQTGRFSNSVELVSLMQGGNTVIGKYTYLLSPYETFENTGRRRWPLAYNPKTLIAKSIRNLAQGRINQKLTLRRV